MSSSGSSASGKKPRRMARYYAKALTPEDKEALASGEKNHNYPARKPEDMIKLHESRKELLHPGPEHREASLAACENDLQETKSNVLRGLKKKVGIFPLISRLSAIEASLPTITVTPPATEAKAVQTPRPEEPRRTASAPVTPFLSPPPTLPSPPAPQTPVFTMVVEEAPENNHHRTMSEGGYFSQTPAQTPIQRPLQRSSRVQPRASRGAIPSQSLRPTSTSSLAVPQSYERRNDINFESFLARHVSGTGEAFRGAENAVKDDQPQDDRKITESRDLETALHRKSSTQKLLRRMSRVPSMPILRSRKSRAELEGQSQSPPDTPLSE